MTRKWGEKSSREQRAVIKWPLLIVACLLFVAMLLLLSGQRNRLRGAWFSALHSVVYRLRSLSDGDQTKFPSPYVPPTANAWHGIRSVSDDDMRIVADSLGGTVIAVGVGTQSADQISARLDLAHSLGYRVIVVMYTKENCSGRPWEWNGSEWVFPTSAIERLHGIAHHPALFAIYALHEPFDYTNECHWTVEQQQDLYQLLKAYSDGAPVWSDMGTLAGWEERGMELTDGICDYCGTFHHRFRTDWSSERSLEETLSTIDADLDTQQRLMPHSQAVFQMQTFSYTADGYSLRLPTPKELMTVRDHLCNLHQPMLYYPWSHGSYDQALKDAPHLWSVVARGCIRTAYLPIIEARADR